MISTRRNPRIAASPVPFALRVNHEINRDVFRDSTSFALHPFTIVGLLSLALPGWAAYQIYHGNRPLYQLAAVAFFVGMLCCIGFISAARMLSRPQMLMYDRSTSMISLQRRIFGHNTAIATANVEDVAVSVRAATILLSDRPFAITWKGFTVAVEIGEHVFVLACTKRVEATRDYIDESPEWVRSRFVGERPAMNWSGDLRLW